MDNLAAALSAHNPRAVIGGNAPPVDPPTPYEIAAKAVNDVYDEAAMWCDGAVVDNQDLADGVANLLGELRKAKKLSDANRKVEKDPFDAGAKEVQTRYKPLLDKADLAMDACEKALTPWLAKVKAENERKAAEARASADAARIEAEAKLRASDATNLAERAAAEALVKDAKRADTIANRAERQTATAGGMMGRAVGLRTVWTATIAEPVAFGRHAWANHRAEYDTFLQELADRLVREGARSLPGVTITETKQAV